MSTQRFDETEHPREETGKFATKPVSEVAGGMDAFAAVEHEPEPEDEAPAEDTRDWGSLDHIKRGSRTPWGPAQTVVTVAPGIVQLDTAGHGGAKLSPARNRQVPPALRNSDGWYEEDSEEYIAVMTFPVEYSKGGRDPVAHAEYARAKVADRFPDKYEAATGTVLAPGESHVKDERVWREAHAGQPIAVGAAYSGDHPGMSEVTTRNGTDERVYLVPTDEYRAGREGLGFVADPARHADITPPPPPPKELAPRMNPVPKTEGLSVTAQTRLAKDMETHWRGEDGKTRSLRTILETEGVTGKGASMFDGQDSTTYYFEQKNHVGQAGGTILPVSKATWDAFGSVPDTRTDRDRAVLEVHRAERALEKTGGGGRLGNWNLPRHQLDKASAARERLAKARGELEAADRAVVAAAAAAEQV